MKKINNLHRSGTEGEVPSGLYPSPFFALGDVLRSRCNDNGKWRKSDHRCMFVLSRIFSPPTLKWSPHPCTFISYFQKIGLRTSTYLVEASSYWARALLHHMYPIMHSYSLCDELWPGNEINATCLDFKVKDRNNLIAYSFMSLTSTPTYPPRKRRQLC